MKIVKDCVVTLRQTVTDQAGAVIDRGDAPIQYFHGGYGAIFAKVEAALDGKGVGDGIQVVLAPGDGFGAFDPALVVTASPDCFHEPPKVGDEVERDLDGATLRFRVTGVDGDGVELDANHPLAGQTLIFSATVADVRPATPEEVASELRSLHQAAAEGRTTMRALARAKAAAQAEAEAAELARAEATDLVETVNVPQLGQRFHLVFRSQTHKLCWLAPLLPLPVAAGLLVSEGWEKAGMAIGVLWLLWTFFSPALIRRAIDRWGYRFLFFDFSPNLKPSRLETLISTGGAVISVLLALGGTMVALFRIEQASDVLAALGAGIAAFLVLAYLLTILLPFLVILLTAFRVRPVLDKAPAGRA